MKILVIILLLILLILILNNPFETKEYFIKEPCSNKLSDKEYLLHMIPHHQVAVDISYLLQDKSKSPVMQEILRKLIWTQRYEIKLMNEMLTKLPHDMSNDNIVMKRNYIVSKSDFMKPNKLGISDTYCDPHFFDPQAHMEHMKHMKLDENMYIKHMIPHHQVAVDMSKKLLKNTKNDFMIYLAYRIIRSQQAEISLLNDLLNKENYFHTSELLI